MSGGSYDIEEVTDFLNQQKEIFLNQQKEIIMAPNLEINNTYEITEQTKWKKKGTRRERRELERKTKKQTKKGN